MSRPEVPYLFEGERLLWTVPAVYTPAECAAFVAFIEREDPALATDNPLYRDQDRLMRDDPAMAADLYRRLEPHLPARMGTWRLAGINERMRYYRYRPGQKFALHTDHWYWAAPDKVTLHTVLVYFNDDFTGGETRFTGRVAEVVRPAPGLVAIFQHKLDHEGCEVLSGAKFALRTDVLYAHGAA